jgi:Short C-terminal domain
MTRAGPSDGRFNATGCIILPASLFIGLMIAGPGTAVYPPVSTVAAPLICTGIVRVQSNYYSVRPGEHGVSRTIYCTSGTDKAAAGEDITWKAIGIAFLIYSAIAFLILRFLVAPWLRRRAERTLLAAGIRLPSNPNAAASPAGLRSILDQVADAAQRRQASVAAASGEEPAERLAQLKQLRDQGLITAADYEAKKAEILSGL